MKLRVESDESFSYSGDEGTSCNSKFGSEPYTSSESSDSDPEDGDGTSFSMSLQCSPEVQLKVTKKDQELGVDKIDLQVSQRLQELSELISQRKFKEV